jgi:hypothetical protein
MPDDSSPAEPQSLGRLAAFRYRDFRLFWFSVFTSNVGTWMQMTAVNWLLYQLTQSPLQHQRAFPRRAGDRARHL